MRILEVRSLVVCMVVWLAWAAPVRAQWAVVDAPAIVQLIQQVQTMQEQLATARNQLQSAQQALQAMTGDRGMSQLLSGTARNYLPSNWGQVTGILQGQGAAAYAGLSADVRNALTNNAVLSPQQLSALSPADQRQIQTARQWIALQQVLSSAALSNASGRFDSIQTLVAAIATAKDQKATLDLQARISVELAMLQNEQTKLQVLQQANQAQQSSLHQQSLERAVLEQGQFATRFQPVPY